VYFNAKAQIRKGYNRLKQMVLFCTFNTLVFFSSFAKPNQGLRRNGGIRLLPGIGLSLFPVIPSNSHLRTGAEGGGLPGPDCILRNLNLPVFQPKHT
jgi:hypothetical protein